MAEIPLQVKITADDEASGKLSGLTNTLKANRESLMAIGAASGVAFAGIAAFANESIKAAEEHENAVAQLNAVIKSTGGAAGITAQAAIDLSEKMQNLTTFDNDAVLATENLLMTFTAIGKDTMPQATQTVLDMATALGEDTKSAAIQLGKALQDPILGVTALRKVGVNFSQDQLAVIKNLVDTGQSAKAQQLILGELNREFGGSAAAAAETYAGKQKQLANQISDVQKTIGQALLPVIGQLVSAIVPIVSKLAEWIQAHPELTKWIVILGGLLTGLIAMLSAIALILPVITAGFAILTGPIGLIILAIAALVAGTVLLVANWGKIKAFFSSLWADVVKIFKEAINSIISFFQPLIDVVQKVSSAISGVASGIGSAASAVGHGISSAVSSIIPHAAGGSVQPGQTYLVGENGPELMQFGGTGFITPNYALQGAGGINISITGTFMSEGAAVAMANKVVDVLKRRTRIGV